MIVSEPLLSSVPRFFLHWLQVHQCPMNLVIVHRYLLGLNNSMHTYKSNV